jgi:DNA-binding FrmR family transcriptional regulator
VKPEHKEAAVRRLQTSVGHLQAVLRMVEDEAYCPDIMKQLSAVQGSLERVNRVVLRNHLETCVADAMQHGRGDEIVDELMTALKFEPTVTGAAGRAPAKPRR